MDMVMDVGWRKGCPDRETLSAFIDRELSEDLLAKINCHVGECPRCADEVGSLEETVGFVRKLEGKALSPDFWLKVSKKLERRRSEPWRPFGVFWKLSRVRIPAVTAFALGFAFLVTGYLVREGMLSVGVGNKAWGSREPILLSESGLSEDDSRYLNVCLKEHLVYEDEAVPVVDEPVRPLLDNIVLGGGQ